MRLRDIANAALHRISLHMLRVRLLLQSRWFAHTYQPDPFSSEPPQSNVRNSFDRWNAFSPLLPDRPLTAIDIGCNDGFFIFRLAARGGICIGIDHDRNAIMIAKARAAIHRASNALFADIKIEKLTSAGLPDVDVVICLSVFHHMVRHNGLAKAKTMFADIAAHAKSHLVFETGQPDEDSSWARELAFMNPDHRVWIRGFLAELGFRHIQEVGEFSTTVSAVPRVLFVARRD